MIPARNTPRDQFTLESVGVVMQADPALPAEAWGVLNPASARTTDGKLLLYPRVVAEGNFSRIEIVEVEGNGEFPARIERQGYALEPREPYEHHLRSHGGVEDPRVTFLRPLGIYVMAYVALGQHGPRIALAVSEDCRGWKRLGLLTFKREANVDWSDHGNKDAAFFPDVVHDADGDPCLAVLHRPTYLVPRADGRVEKVLPEGVEDDRGSIWMSFVSLKDALTDTYKLTSTYHSTLLATPEADWEALKIGSGTPPMLTSSGWVLYYHGVQGKEPSPEDPTKNV